MDFQKGNIVKHKLTGEELIVVEVTGSYISVRNCKYEIITVEPEEIELKDKND